MLRKRDGVVKETYLEDDESTGSPTHRTLSCLLGNSGSLALEGNMEFEEFQKEFKFKPKRIKF